MLQKDLLGGLVVAALASALPGCAASPAVVNTAPDRLAAYGGRVATLFDDEIEPEAVGYSLDPAPAPEGDSLLRERTQVGDCVLRVRVVTVTSRHQDTGPSWRLGLHTLEKLAGERLPSQDFTLDVPGGSPGSFIVKTFEGRLIGVNLVAFVREFRGSGGEATFHFHLAPEGQDEVKAVRVAALLGEVRPPAPSADQVPEDSHPHRAAKRTRAAVE